MKKTHVLLLLAMTSTMLLFGCGKDANEQPANVEQEITLDDESTPTNESEAENGEAPETEESREGMVRSSLTNEWIDESIADNRPIAFMFPHDKVAMPQYGIADVDILYEIYAQSSEPRMMGVIKDWQSMERIGNIRSCRDYYVYLALEWDAIYCNYGLVVYAEDILKRADVDYIDGGGNPNGMGPNANGKTYYRSSDKNAPHNVYTSGELLKADAESKNYSLTYRDQYYVADHFKFASDDAPNTLDNASGAFTATNIDMSGAFGVDKPTFEYNAADGLYYRNMYGNPHTDANGKQLAFANVIVQNTYAEARDPNKYWYYQIHDDTRDGYFFTQGKGIHVTWKKSDNYEPTKYYDDNGNEVVFNTGKTMIFIVQDGQKISYN